ncbi:MAG: acyltransferase family protein, partial [Roseovarius sp.]|nr:acyltransferase family protein [Roseovarius sp.]
APRPRPPAPPPAPPPPPPTPPPPTYLGVDVFFVISGYLITTLLIEDREAGRFRIVNFYERRIRRIFPALFAVMLFCIPFAWMWMLPSQMKDFSQSLVAVSLFASNFHFWNESDYFAMAAEEKPLLHTWSLAVEEQFYFIFPFVLLLIWRFAGNRATICIALIALSSLALSEYGWRRSPPANFYFTLKRAWELLAGSMAAFAVHKHGVRDSNALSLIVLAAIVFAIFAYDRNTPIPSVYALIPVVGVVLLVLYAGENTIAAKFLSLKIFAGIGLISYSAYLWHQPFFAFARIVNIREPSLTVMISLTMLSFAFAYFTWRFIEIPFRNMNLISRKHIYRLAFAGMVFFAITGLIGDKNDGFGRAIEIEKVSSEAMTNSSFVVLGDSHAGHLASGLRRITTGEVVEMTGGGCIPFRDVDRYDSRVDAGWCVTKMNENLKRISKMTDTATVIISTMGPVYLDGTTFLGRNPERVHGNEMTLITDSSIADHYEIFETGLRNTIVELLQNENLNVVYAVDVPELGIDHGCGGIDKVIEIYGLKINDFIKDISLDPNLCSVSRNLYDKRVKAYKELVFGILADFPEVTLFDPTDHFCDEMHCRGYIEGYGYLYYDADHLSESGSLYYARQLGSHLSQAMGGFIPKAN